MFIISLIILAIIIYFVSELSVSKEGYTNIKRSRSFKFDKVITSDYEEEPVQKYKYDISFEFSICKNELVSTSTTTSTKHTFSVFPIK